MEDINSVKYTAADALTDALVRSGVKYIFLNSGTDYPALIESWAKFEAEGRELPEIIICPHEMVAMSAAQGYAQATGEPAGVFVHVDVGTQNIGGALANAFRARIPVLILAGMSPYTMDGELPGSRDNPIQYIQNCTDQGNIVREYVKHYTELRSGTNIQKVLYRALQLAKTAPQAPVYLTAPREVLAEEGWDIGPVGSGWQPPAPLAVDPASLATLMDALSNAKNPLIAVSYMGKQQESVGELVKFCGKLSIPVVETTPSYVNFPGDHSLHLGTDLPSALKDCDVLLVIDNETPWIPAKFNLPSDCRLFFLDIDPVKEDIPLWHYPVELYIKADSLTALKQMNDALSYQKLSTEMIAARRENIESRHKEIVEQRTATIAPNGCITPPFLFSCVREVIDDQTIIVNESITNFPIVETYLPRNEPGTRFPPGGSSLGWHGGAAIGIKLANPERDVVAITGDGSYVFSCPTAVYWVARKYNTPFMTIVLNNGGWTAPKGAVLSQYPDGYAAKQHKFWADFEPSSRYDLIAEAAGGAFAAKAEDPKELQQVLKDGMEAIRSGRCAVINVILR
jgi:acetolactate synthase-1/2/3 large subunit